MKMLTPEKRFWDWTEEPDTGQKVLRLEGVIAQESWFGDEVTPAVFQEELKAVNGPVTVMLNSPGGDCIAASLIYTMLMEHPFDVHVIIDGIAASAASVIAMAGTTVSMSPTALMMVHDPWTNACGNADDMHKAISLLDEVKESIINAYEIKTGLSRDTLSGLMKQETWMNACRARELGFCDEVLYTEGMAAENAAFSFSGKAAELHLMDLVTASLPADSPAPKPVQDEPLESAQTEPKQTEPIQIDPVVSDENQHGETKEPEEPVTGRVRVSATDARLDDLRY